MLRSVALVVLAAAVVRGEEGLIQTQYGLVQGIVLPEGVAYEGVPYAAPPVGDLRWKSPQPVTPWAPAVWNATADPKGCMQICVDNEPPHICPVVVNEDCLFLNIWTPRAPNGLPATVRTQRAARSGSETQGGHISGDNVVTAFVCTVSSYPLFARLSRCLLSCLSTAETSR